MVGGHSENSAGGIYAIQVSRNAAGHITGFSGSATEIATAPYIDGGLAYGPGNVLFYTAYPGNSVGEIKPGSTSPDKVVSLSPLGVTSTVGGLQFVPTGIPGAGQLKLTSYSGGGFYTTTLSADGSGTYDITSATLGSSPTGEPEGIAYVTPGSPLFPNASVLLAQYSSSFYAVGAYQVDANGNPIVNTRQDFVTSIATAEGLATDPLTGDLLIDTWSPSRIDVVTGFAIPTPEPSSLVLLGVGVAGLLVFARQRGWRGKNARWAAKAGAILFAILLASPPVVVADVDYYMVANYPASQGGYWLSGSIAVDSSGLTHLN